MRKLIEEPRYRHISDYLIEGEVDFFFDSNDVEEIYDGTEGKGREQTNITIWESKGKYLKKIEDFGFDEFVSRYYFIQLLND